jgi:hypothetical protein
MGLDQLEALVHHGGGIDGNLVAHVPVGVGNGLFRRRPGHFGQRPFPKRSAGRCQYDALDGFAAVLLQDLKDRVVLGIDRKQGRTTAGHLGHHEFAGADQGLLVGQGDHGAASDRRQGRRQTGRADDRGHDPVGRALGRFDQGLRACRYFDPGAGEGRLEIAVTALVADHDQLRSQPPCLFGEHFGR